MSKIFPQIYKHVIAAFSAITFAMIFYTNSFKLRESAARLPRILMALIFILSLGMVFEMYWKAKNPDRKRELSESEKLKAEMMAEEDKEGPINHKRAIIFTLLVASYIALLKPIGYFIVTPIYVMLAYLFLKATKIRNMILISIGFTAFVYFVFVVFLKIPIPLGLMR